METTATTMSETTMTETTTTATATTMTDTAPETLTPTISSPLSTIDGEISSQISLDLDVDTASNEEDPAVTRFREYLRCDSSHPNPDYTSAVEFLKGQADEIGLQCDVLYPAGEPIVLMHWKGSDPSKESILLNSHMDVVAVYPEFWTYNPWEAVKTPDGMIYARGAQDMKSIGMQHLEAVRRLKACGKKLPRTVVLSFVPDEEIGGFKGMKALIESGALEPFNIAFSLDEASVAGKGKFLSRIFYAERVPFQFEAIITGTPGHAAAFIRNTAAEKFRRLLNSLLDFRAKQETVLRRNPRLRLCDVSTVNFTKVNGGVQTNVVPSELTATFDVRISPRHSLQDFEKQLQSWITHAGEGIRVNYLNKSDNMSKSDVSPDAKWWSALSNSLTEIGVTHQPGIGAGITDSRYLREIGVQAFGFSANHDTQPLAHAHDECLHESVFLRGIDIFERVVEDMASVK